MANVESSEDTECHHRTHNMARLLGTKIIVARPAKADMMAIELNRLYSIPALTVEIGELYFPRRNVSETIRSSMCGYVFSLWDRSQAPEGATLYSIPEHDDCHVARTTLNMFKLLPKLSTR